MSPGYSKICRAAVDFARNNQDLLIVGGNVLLRMLCTYISKMSANQAAIL